MRDPKTDEFSRRERALASRRSFLMKSGTGLCSVALTHMLAEDGFLGRVLAADDPVPNALAAKKPHLRPRANSVIWLFMEGGPSHLDTFDPKPALEALAGKPMPESRSEERRVGKEWRTWWRT